MQKIKKPSLIVIVGPTASGKSDLGIKIAKKLSAKGGPASGWNGAEIISADSRQVYREMDIGTGKVARDATLPVPSLKVKSKKLKVLLSKDFYSEGIRHHLINVASPKKQFTADDFKKLGQKAIDDILSRGKVPVIVGGTGFYIDVLLGRMSVAEVPPNKKLRARFDKLTVERLFKMLQKLDPRRAGTIEPKNKRRLIRALEIVLTTDKPVSRSMLHAPSFETLWLGLRPKNLEQRIKTRLDSRLRQGMVKEVFGLRRQGLTWKRLDDLGLEYRQISLWLRNQKSNIKNQNDRSKFKNFKSSPHYEKLLREIIKYSKRQMTWFKKNKEIRWLAPSKVEGVKNQKEATRLVSQFLR